MNVFRITVLSLFAAACLCGALSCAKEEPAKKEEPAITKDDGLISYVNENVVFGVYFDAEGTKRTIKLDRDVREFDVHVIVHFPEEMQIAATEFKLILPDGVSIVNDKYSQDRVMSLGTFDGGLSERFPCRPGPMMVVHTLTLRADKPLENAIIGLGPSENAQFIGVAECEEGYPRARARAYRAVINPTE